MDKPYLTLKVTSHDEVLWLWLNRPEVRNAFDSTMISEITDLFANINGGQHALRAVVISGVGETFCAGADLNWMRSLVDYSYDDNRRDSQRLAEMFRLIAVCHLPTIARVNGPAIGGGTGLAAVCDIVIASENAVFGLSEVKLGLAPAVISPYVARRIGDRYCREYFLTGERIDARRAVEIGLANTVVPLDLLDVTVNQKIDQLLSSGPNAIAACKKILAMLLPWESNDIGLRMADIIAELRVGPEGQEGMRAFLERRKPKWHRQQ